MQDGHPFEYATHVTHTVQDGRVVYDRGAYLNLPFARRALPLLGGAGAGCCLGQWKGAGPVTSPCQPAGLA